MPCSRCRRLWCVVCRTYKHGGTAVVGFVECVDECEYQVNECIYPYTRMTCILTYTRTCTLTYMVDECASQVNECIHPYTHMTCILTYTHAYRSSEDGTRSLLCLYTYMYIHIHRLYTYMHIHIRGLHQVIAASVYVYTYTYIYVHA